MNKKIKEIANLVKLQPYYDAQEGQIEQFAKLIIQECHRAAERYIIDCGEVNGVPESVFKSHFGIEE
jgi:hypothetical protein